jgi:hypothetical protein
MIVTVVLLTTLLTPLMLRGAFQMKCAEDDEEISGGTEASQEPSLNERSFGEIGGPDSGQSIYAIRHDSATLAPAILTGAQRAGASIARISALEQPPSAG